VSSCCTNLQAESIRKVSQCWGIRRNPKFQEKNLTKEQEEKKRKKEPTQLESDSDHGRSLCGDLSEQPTHPEKAGVQE